MLACGPSSLWPFILGWPLLMPVACIVCWVFAWKGIGWLVNGIEWLRHERIRRRQAPVGFPVKLRVRR